MVAWQHGNSVNQSFLEIDENILSEHMLFSRQCKICRDLRAFGWLSLSIEQKVASRVGQKTPPSSNCGQKILSFQPKTTFLRCDFANMGKTTFLSRSCKYALYERFEGILAF